MKEEDKQLLLRDLCVRLPYGVKFNYGGYDGCDYKVELMTSAFVNDFPIEDIKPYLRPMSSMTEEEKIELTLSGCRIKGVGWNGWVQTVDTIDLLNKGHFDYRGLIPKGLAIAVTEENNPYKE